MPLGKYEVYKDAGGKFRWRLRASNDDEIASSSGPGYESKEGCMDGIKSVKKNARSKIVDTTE